MRPVARIIPLPPFSRQPLRQHRQCLISRFRSIRDHSSTASKPSISHHSSRRRRKLIYVTTTLTLTYVAWTQYRTHQTHQSSSLDPKTFQPFTIHSIEPISPNSTSSIFTLQPSSSTTRIPTPENAIWSVAIKQPLLQIARSYTPLPPSTPTTAAAQDQKNIIRLLIRHNPHGEVSSYLHSLRPGDVLELRGPRVEYVVPDGLSEVVFLAGGTGIAPALQLCDGLLHGLEEGREVRVRILWACRSREDCLGVGRGSCDGTLTQKSHERNDKKRKTLWRSYFWKQPAAQASDTENTTDTATSDKHNGGERRKEKGIIVQHLETLQSLYPESIKVEYFVDAESTFISRDDVLRCMAQPQSFSDSVDKHNAGGRQQEQQRQLSTDDPSTKSAKKKKKIIFVSGPEGFVAALAGARSWEGGKEGQGRVGGLLESVALDGSRGEEEEEEEEGWEVWKL